MPTDGYDAHDFPARQVIGSRSLDELVGRLMTAVEDGDGHQPRTVEGLEELTTRLMPAMTKRRRSEHGHGGGGGGSSNAWCSFRTTSWSS